MGGSPPSPRPGGQGEQTRDNQCHANTAQARCQELASESCDSRSRGAKAPSLRGQGFACLHGPLGAAQNVPRAEGAPCTPGLPRGTEGRGKAQLLRAGRSLCGKGHGGAGGPRQAPLGSAGPCRLPRDLGERLWCQRLRLNVSSQVRRSHFRLLNSVLLFTKTRSRRPRAAEAREAAARRGWPASGTEGCFRADSNSLTAHRLLEVKRH